LSSPNLTVGRPNKPTNFDEPRTCYDPDCSICSIAVDSPMTQARLLEVARLKGLIARLKRQYGLDDTLAMLEQVILMELTAPVNRADEPSDNAVSKVS